MSEHPEWLSEEARAVYDATLARLKDVTPEKLEMLAAYADAAVNFRQFSAELERAKQWRAAMLYARNGLGLWPPVYVDLFELLFESTHFREDPHLPYEHLKTDWQLPETERLKT